MSEITAEMLGDEVKNKPQRVAVVNFDMEFGTMVRFLVKLAIAAIPAAIILAIMAAVLAAVFRGMHL
jgi:hypothetical protein